MNVLPQFFFIHHLLSFPSTSRKIGELQPICERILQSDRDLVKTRTSSYALICAMLAATAIWTRRRRSDHIGVLCSHESTFQRFFLILNFILRLDRVFHFTILRSNASLWYWIDFFDDFFQFLTLYGTGSPLYVNIQFFFFFNFIFVVTFIALLNLIKRISNLI